MTHSLSLSDLTASIRVGFGENWPRATEHGQMAYFACAGKVIESLAAVWEWRGETLNRRKPGTTARLLDELVRLYILARLANGMQHVVPDLNILRPGAMEVGRALLMIPDLRQMLMNPGLFFAAVRSISQDAGDSKLGARDQVYTRIILSSAKGMS